MPVLALLWSTGIAFAAVAVSALIARIAARTLLDMRAARRAVRRQRLAAIFMRYLHGEIDLADLSRFIRRRGDLTAVIGICADAATLVLGQELDRAAAFLKSSRALDELLGTLSSSSPDMRRKAVHRLGFARTERSTATLRRLLGDDDPHMRASAALALAHQGALKPDDLFGVSTTPVELSAALGQIVQTMAEDGIAEVEHLLGTDHDAALRATALRAVGRAKNGRFTAAILAQLDDADPVVRAAALAGLGDLGGPVPPADILPMLSDRHPGVRAEAARFIRKHPVAEAAPTLRAMLHDPDWWVRYRAAQALAALGHDGLDILRSVGRRFDAAGETAALALGEAEAP